MSEVSKIEWTDATWNPITGCTLVSEGCRNCYAAHLAATRLKHHPSREGLATMNAEGVAKFTGKVRFNEGWLDQPLRWKRPRMIFVCAHGDLFHEAVPDEWIDRVFAVMALAQRHTFQVLTKRPERMRAYFAGEPYDRINGESAIFEHWDRMEELDPPPMRNVWLGTSVEDQATANERTLHLIETPAAVRFISAEPLLGPVDLTELWIDGDPDQSMSALHGIRSCPDGSCFYGGSIDWVIVGGESGRHAREMKADWARSLRDQCRGTATSYYFKQWGNWINGANVGNKSATGRYLDGRTWDEFPLVVRRAA